MGNKQGQQQSGKQIKEEPPAQKEKFQGGSTEIQSEIKQGEQNAIGTEFVSLDQTLQLVSSFKMWELRSENDLFRQIIDQNKKSLKFLRIQKEGTQNEQYVYGQIINSFKSEKLNPNDQLYSGLTNYPFFDMFWLAYNTHGYVTITPDDFWTHISMTFAKYITKNSEQFRQKFVAHEGRKELQIMYDMNIHGNPRKDDFDWAYIFDSFAKEIKKNTLNDITETITADFSTTGPLQKIISQICLMDTLQNYFSYQMSTMCGIRGIKILGTIDDWKKIKTKLDKLGTFELKKWVGQVQVIVDRLIQTKIGNPDLTWWKNIFTEHQTHGSGGSLYIRGWIKDLFLYDQNNEFFLFEQQKIQYNDFPALISLCPFTLNENGKHTNLYFVGGFSAVIESRYQNFGSYRLNRVGALGMRED